MVFLNPLPGTQRKIKKLAGFCINGDNPTGLVDQKDGFFAIPGNTRSAGCCQQQEQHQQQPTHDVAAAGTDADPGADPAAVPDTAPAPTVWV